MAARPSVLVVDPLEETQEVLRTALAERGVEVVAARNSAQALALVRRSLPSLIVVDLESDGGSAVMTGKLLAESAARDTPLLAIGTAKGKTGRLATGRPLAKPYHYAALIHRIEELLGEVVKGARRREAKAA